LTRPSTIQSIGEKIMVRKSSTKTTENPTEQIMNAINTPVNLEWSDTAEKLNTSIPELQERVAAKLNDSTVFAWDSLPAEHESIIEAISRDLEAEASVRRLNAASEPPIPQAQAQEEPPILEEEADPQGKLARSKQAATGLTQKRKAAIDKTAKTSKKLGKGLDEAELLVEAQRGRKKGAKKAAVRLLAEEETYNEVLTKAAIQRLADAVGETEEEQEFDPLAYVRQAGSEDIDETLKSAMEKITPVLGKLGEAANEVVDNSYTNGSTLDLSRLERLMRSTD
jgi:hypothetical protein